ncbi:uncharacterized protein A4U43_C05F23910 [Asparagus officinalis]|nr:uncharacterized protein A4U43_C05F23910 [Asparagus officinalis]
MRLWSFSPLVGLIVFITIAVLLGAFSRSIFDSNILGTSQEFEVLHRIPSKGSGKPPIFAYWISGTGGESEKILRLLKAVYHPRNRYLLHLDAGSKESERIDLAKAVQSERVFKAFGNVGVVGRTYAVDRTAASAVASVLHGAAMLLKINQNWDWFITLSASDYPLVTQDDLLHVFTSVPRDLNFIESNHFIILLISTH